MSNLIRKISAKNVVGKVTAPEKATDLYHCYGIANKTRNGTSDNGPWTALVGQFEAVNLETGETFVAPQCFLPEPLNSMIAMKLDETDADGNQVNNSVQFAVVVGVKPSSTPIGYEYTTRELVKSEQADPLAALRDQVKALPAPEKPAKKK